MDMDIMCMGVRVRVLCGAGGAEGACEIMCVRCADAVRDLVSCRLSSQLSVWLVAAVTVTRSEKNEEHDRPSACAGSLVAVWDTAGRLVIDCVRTRSQRPMRAPPSHHRDHGHGIPAPASSACARRKTFLHAAVPLLPHPLQVSFATTLTTHH